MNHWEIVPAADGPLTLRPLSNFSTAWLYGYQVYTTFRLPLSKRWLSAHLDRLIHDAHAMDIDWCYDRGLLMETLLAAYQAKLPVNRLSLIANVQRYQDFDRIAPLPCQLILSQRPAPKAVGTALRLQSVQRPKYLPQFKLGCQMETIHLKRLARQQGAHDVLLLNHQGNISEASTANIFFIQNQSLVTPNPKTDDCLPGITRERILEIGKTRILADCRIETVALSTLNRMDGAFLCNAVQGIIPVQGIDDVVFSWPPEAVMLVEKFSMSLNDTGEATSNYHF